MSINKKQNSVYSKIVSTRLYLNRCVDVSLSYRFRPNHGERIGGGGRGTEQSSSIRYSAAALDAKLLRQRH